MLLKSANKLIKFHKALFSCRALYCTQRPPPFDAGAPFRAKPEDIPKGIWSEDTDSPPYTSVEEVKDHWHFVERLLPKLRIPEPPRDVSSVGWKAPDKNLPDLPYFVQRSRNYMLPVYEDLYYKDSVRVTTVTRVHGDIWQFEYDLKTYLEEKLGEKLESHVIEIACKVNFRGQHVDIIKEWLYSKGVEASFAAYSTSQLCFR